MASGVGPRNHVTKRRVYWHQLANIIERLCATASWYHTTGGDTACSQIIGASLLGIRIWTPKSNITLIDFKSVNVTLTGQPTGQVPAGSIHFISVQMR